ncbi:GNAT family N-acetyltransferase [Robbsia sp. Bb-Pol-6]|uniref:GNAT family N-acetyltransferase n=1 Tax=Robbsia betulipollinis TaxID=2981849 RepID=A0ABT3ZJM6_9BURK|nr:GNAT family N-acetyltransferase [Robbsia betulipollinis]MCY0386652.1 GNAT family N-acetyltransferase [Robbsia betulipollinis]
MSDLAPDTGDGAPAAAPGFTVRILSALDADRYQRLRLRAIDDSPTAIWPTRDEQARRSIPDIVARIRPMPDQVVFGAFADDALVGVTGLARETLRQISHKASVWGVFVEPGHRGRGIAASLLRAATEHAAAEWRCLQLQLRVNSANIAAKKLYVAHGFTCFGTEPQAMQVDGRFYDEDHMVKHLR